MPACREAQLYVRRMVRVRRGYIHKVYVFVRQHGLIASIGARHAVRSGKGLRPGQPARGHGQHLHATTLHGRHGVRHFRGYLPRAQNTDIQLHIPFSLS